MAFLYGEIKNEKRRVIAALDLRYNCKNISLQKLMHDCLVKCKQLATQANIHHFLGTVFSLQMIYTIIYTMIFNVKCACQPGDAVNSAESLQPLTNFFFPVVGGGGGIAAAQRQKLFFSDNMFVNLYFVPSIFPQCFRKFLHILSIILKF